VWFILREVRGLYWFGDYRGDLRAVNDSIELCYQFTYSCFLLGVGGKLVLVKLINLYSFAIMAKIIIDTDKWTTQADKAKSKGCSIQYINKLIKQGKIASLPLPVIGLVLVEK
jgi:hypothetical protein